MKDHLDSGAPDSARAIPWPVLLMAAIVVALVFGVAVPPLLPHSPAGIAAVTISRSLAVAGAVLFIVFAFAGFAKQRRERVQQAELRRVIAARSAQALGEGSTAAARKEPDPNATLPAIDWDRTMIIPHARADAPKEWTQDLLARMDWKRLQALATAYFESVNFRVEHLGASAEGSVSAKLYRKGEEEPVAIVQHNAWNVQLIDTHPLRELEASMARHGLKRGIFLSVGDFTAEAVAFAKGHMIQLLSGNGFLKRLNDLPAARKLELLALATEGDWATPSCPSCGTQMVKRSGDGIEFWACSNFPNCKQSFVLRPG